MNKGIGRRLSLFIVPLVCSWLIKLWFSTCRLHTHDERYRQQAEKRGMPIIGSCWHYCIMGVFAFYRGESLLVMVSASNDGDYLSRMARSFGFSVVRGSRNRRGVSAAKELIRELKNGQTVALVADGSQGPARVVQPGAVLLASKTGGTILPMVWSASSYFAFNSWDRLILPRPFSRLDIFYGNPLLIPKGIKAVEMEEYRLILEEKLNSLYDNAWQIQGKKEH